MKNSNAPGVSGITQPSGLTGCAGAGGRKENEVMGKCGECIHIGFDYQDHVYYCDNEESEYYGVMTAYDDECSEFEENK